MELAVVRLVGMFYQPADLAEWVRYPNKSLPQGLGVAYALDDLEFGRIESITQRPWRETSLKTCEEFWPVDDPVIPGN